MEWTERDRGDLVARSVGAALFAEAGLLAVSRLLTFVYIVAVQVNISDEDHLPKTMYVPFLLSSILLVTILIGAGAQLRRAPGYAWGSTGLLGRVDLALAGALNLALAAWACLNFVSSAPLGAESRVAWILAGLLGLAVVVGLVRVTAGRARPTVER